MVDLYSEAAEIAYLSGNFEQMECFIELVLEQANNLLDQVRVYQVRLDAYQAQNKELEAIQIALPTLEKLGIVIPQEPQIEDIQKELAETQRNLADKKIEELIYPA